MQNETIYEGLKQEFRGLKDPGNILILVYILLIVVLLLFAGLQSAKADFHVTKEGTFSIEHRGEFFPPKKHPTLPVDHVQYVEKGPSLH